jgi:putative transposase
MVYDPQRHHRRSIRLKGYDYRNGGAYFITICTTDRACVFGGVGDGVVHPTRRGLIARASWDDIPNHRAYVELDKFVANHVHGILWVVCDDVERATQVSPLQRGPRLMPDSLGAIVGAYKAAVSRTINKLRPGAGRDFWQPNYFERIIRDHDELDALRGYIDANPRRWEHDEHNPDGDGADAIEAFLSSLSKPGNGDTSVAPTEGRIPFDGGTSPEVPHA